jgi:hypothetical protein
MDSHDCDITALSAIAWRAKSNRERAVAKFMRSVRLLALVFTLVASATGSAQGSLFTLAATGTITFNSSQDSTIPIGTPWTFEVTYNTAAPDLDFELTSAPDPTFGRFTNSATPAALTSFHYQAGGYEVTVDDAADFDAFSAIHITFTSINAIDINIQAVASFPPLAGGPVSFHADFNRFHSPSVFTSDSLPTNTALSLGDFDENTVTLLPAVGGAISSSNVTSLTFTAVPGLSGDFDSDGDVDGRDFLTWQRSPQLGSLEDWQNAYGDVAPTAEAVSPVPEPTSLLLMIGASALACRRMAIA